MIDLFDTDKSKNDGFLTEPVVAMAYVPMQEFCSTFSPVQALTNGTLFPELRKPFQGKTLTGGAGYED